MARMLAKRLVQHMNSSKNAEVTMIPKPTQACCPKYEKHLTNSGGPLDINFSIQVLSSGSWPFQQPGVFSLPAELERCIRRFTALYGGQHSGRKPNLALLCPVENPRTI